MASAQLSVTVLTVCMWDHRKVAKDVFLGKNGKVVVHIQYTVVENTVKPEQEEEVPFKVRRPYVIQEFTERILQLYMEKCPVGRGVL